MNQPRARRKGNIAMVRTASAVLLMFCIAVADENATQPTTRTASNPAVGLSFSVTMEPSALECSQLQPRITIGASAPIGLVSV
jgi:hypothetical protein